MTDSNSSGTGPTGTRPERGDVARELHELGRNLANILRDAWESDERKRLHEEIRAGMADFTTTVNQAYNDFRQSPTGQRMEEDVKDFKERVRTGDVDAKIRQEILSALRTVNQELEKATRKNTPPPPPPPADEPPVV